MGQTVQRTVALSLFLILAACGGGGGGTSSSADTGGGTGGGGNGDGGGTVTPPPITTPLLAATGPEQSEYTSVFLPAFEISRDTAQDGGLTPLANLPAPGAVEYQGHMLVNFLSTPSASIRGDATLTIDMTTGATTGQADGFLGYYQPSDGSPAQLAHYNGTVTLSGGGLSDRGDGTNAYSLLANGSFDNGIQTLTLSGQLNGAIFGATGDGVFVSGAQNFFNDDLTLTVDGVEVDGDAGIWAVATSP